MQKQVHRVAFFERCWRIYLLDIETPSASGIDIARKIRKHDIESMIIFITGHEELGDVVLKNNTMFLSFSIPLVPNALSKVFYFSSSSVKSVISRNFSSSNFLSGSCKV